MESLTARVLQFQRTGDGGEELLREVARRVYEYPRRKCRWDDEASSEFFARVYPKVRDMVARFRNVGRPFESYLASMLLFQVRTFVQRRRKRELEWEVAAQPDLWGIEGAETGVQVEQFLDSEDPVEASGLSAAFGICADRERPRPEGGPWLLGSAGLRRLFDIGSDGVIRSACSRHSLLVAILKSAHLLADADVAAVARLIGMDEERLHSTVRKLGERRGARLRRLELFTGRRNRAFAGLRLAQTRLAREVDPERRGELERKAERLRKTLRSCQRTLARMHLGPTHRQIAEALGIPKATVDSTMYRLKHKAAAFYADRHEEYA
jgi:RNA polymerase sigma factor (sigma-70 family)